MLLCQVNGFLKSWLKMRAACGGAAAAAWSNVSTPRVGIDEKARPVVVVERGRDHAAEELRAVGVLRLRQRVVETRPATHDEVVGAADVPGEAGARRHVGEIADVLAVAEVTRFEPGDVGGGRRRSVVDRNGVLDHPGGARRVPGHVPAQSVIDRDVVPHAPVVAHPERPGGPGHVERPVAPVVVALEPLRERVDAGEVPLRRVVGRARGNPRGDVGRHRRERHDALALQVPQRVDLRVDELGAHLEVVAAAVPGQVVAALRVVLIEPLRIVVRLADGEPGEAVLEGVADLRQALVGPLEVVVAEFQLLDQRAAQHARPRAEHVGGLLGLHRGVRGVPGGRQHEWVRPVPVRSAHGQPVVVRQLVVGAPQEAPLRVLERNREGLSGQRRRRGKARARLTLVLVRGEVMQAVLDDRTADVVILEFSSIFFGILSEEWLSEKFEILLPLKS